MVGGRYQDHGMDSRRPSSVIRVVLVGRGEKSSSESSRRGWVNKKPYDKVSCRMMMARLADWPRAMIVIVIAKTYPMQN
jgi:hypothetical protein